MNQTQQGYAQTTNYSVRINDIQESCAQLHLPINGQTLHERGKDYAEQERQERAGYHNDDIPCFAPTLLFHFTAEFEGNPATNQGE
ncbi:hypothetical protein D3C74_440830 [compost metagenome]